MNRLLTSATMLLNSERTREFESPASQGLNRTMTGRSSPPTFLISPTARFNKLVFPSPYAPVTAIIDGRSRSTVDTRASTISLRPSRSSPPSGTGRSDSTSEVRFGDVFEQLCTTKSVAAASTTPTAASPIARAAWRESRATTQNVTIDRTHNESSNGMRPSLNERQIFAGSLIKRAATNIKSATMRVCARA